MAIIVQPASPFPCQKIHSFKDLAAQFGNSWVDAGVNDRNSDALALRLLPHLISPEIFQVPRLIPLVSRGMVCRGDRYQEQGCQRTENLYSSPHC
ncbi:hypothetical protein [Streptomyces sodiiphilus]|uniref:hypothetical protein n=1 Tax=Streptomyces sodiiphilus TaxID=226217 RepID=UPI0031E46E75